MQVTAWRSQHPVDRAQQKLSNDPEVREYERNIKFLQAYWHEYQGT
jgi:hypothetical protein